MPPTTKKEQKPVVDKEAVQAQLYNKKVRSLTWKDDKIVAVILADGTRIEASEIKIKAV